MTITSNQCRAARELLNWTQADLQNKSKLGIETIGNFERGTGNPTQRTMDDIKRAFEGSGIKFVISEKEKGVVLVEKNKKSK
jgi:transcriptional regulator with XRE-family HTH domain